MKTAKPSLIWLTGLSGAGKTTLGTLLQRHLTGAGCRAELLDGDELRKSLSKDLGFSKEDRDTHIARVGDRALTLARRGVWAVVAAISPYRAARDGVRQKSAEEGIGFVEVFVSCPLAVAEARDPKGIYKKARRGEIRNFTGISDPYEEPLSPELLINTDRETPETSAGKIVAFLAVMNRR